MHEMNYLIIGYGKGFFQCSRPRSPMKLVSELQQHQSYRVRCERRVSMSRFVSSSKDRPPQIPSNGLTGVADLTSHVEI